MTYDVQRWEVMHGHIHPVGRHAPRSVKIVVLAADAEAHERDRLAAQALVHDRELQAAVEAAFQSGMAQAVRAAKGGAS